MRRIVCTMVLILTILYQENGWAWNDEVTHQYLSEKAAEHSVLGSAKGNYLKNLGFNNNLDEIFTLNGESKKIRDWIRFGALKEDFATWGTLISQTAPFYNHFHNPLTNTGLDDYVLGIYYVVGQSSRDWAQDNNNEWSWQRVREYFYIAMTGKDLNGNLIAADKTQRDIYYANTFRGLGHLMHLVHDMSVPERVRNEGHAFRNGVLL